MSSSIVVVDAAELAQLVKQSVETALEAGRPALLTRPQLAEQLQVSARHLSNLEAEGLPVVHVGSSPRYELAACLEWLRARASR